MIVLRGPAGAGKSTITKELLQSIRRTGRLCAYLEQDHARNIVAGAQTGSRELSSDLLLAGARCCRNRHYDIVMEGILNIEHYRPLFDTLRAEFGRENVIFVYLNVPLSVTQERHATRDKAKDFGPDKLEKWYSSVSPSGYPHEIMIEAPSSLNDSVLRVTQRVGTPSLLRCIS